MDVLAHLPGCALVREPDGLLLTLGDPDGYVLAGSLAAVPAVLAGVSVAGSAVRVVLGCSRADLSWASDRDLGGSEF